MAAWAFWGSGMLIVCAHCLKINRVPDGRTTEEPSCGHCHQLLLGAQPVALDDASFDAVVSKTELPVVVDFWADWCGPCKQVSPIIEELARQHGDKVTFVKMDTNTNPVTPANSHVLGLPTIQVYVGGELVKAFKGAKSKSALLGAIEEYL